MKRRPLPHRASDKPAYDRQAQSGNPDGLGFWPVPKKRRSGGNRRARAERERLREMARGG